MAEAIVDNKRIAKNTIFLYMRTLFVMVISLYTSRVVLATLGVEDYGVYITDYSADAIRYYSPYYFYLQIYRVHNIHLIYTQTIYLLQFLNFYQFVYLLLKNTIDNNGLIHGLH